MKKTLLIFVFSFLSHSFSSAQTVSDFDKNIYNVVTIGSQVWLKENLKSVHYSNGVPIPYACSYMNNDSLANIYGRLYSWEGAMNGSNIEKSQGACPASWHIPSDAEWQTLISYLGGESQAGYKLKESGLSHWSNPNTGDNSSGFSAVAAGNGYNCTGYDLMGTHAEFWTSTEIDSYSAKNWSLANMDNSVFRHYNQDKPNGFSVRCLKNEKVASVIPSREINLKISPNPVKDILFIQTDYSTNYSLEVLDITGKVVIKKESENRNNLDLSELTPGLYFLKLTFDKNVIVRKINKI